ncbi:MAG: hypothetical protein WEB79_08475 [Thermoleophilaceae bacterium]
MSAGKARVVEGDSVADGLAKIDAAPARCVRCGQAALIEVVTLEAIIEHHRDLTAKQIETLIVTDALNVGGFGLVDGEKPSVACADCATSGEVVAGRRELGAAALMIERAGFPASSN